MDPGDDYDDYDDYDGKKYGDDDNDGSDFHLMGPTLSTRGLTQIRDEIVIDDYDDLTMMIMMTMTVKNMMMMMMMTVVISI